MIYSRNTLLLILGLLVPMCEAFSLRMSNAAASMTVAEIKILLRTRGLPVSGLKAELMERLSSSPAEGNRGGNGIDGRIDDIPASTRAQRRAVLFGSGSSSSSSSSSQSKPRSGSGDANDAADAAAARLLLTSPSFTRPSQASTFLDFDDSVFDRARESTRGMQRREAAAQGEFSAKRFTRPVRDRDGRERERGGGGDSDILEAGRSFQRGQRVSVVVDRLGTLGASVFISPVAEEGGTAAASAAGESRLRGRGLVLQQDLVYWRASSGVDAKVGDVLPAFVESVRPDGRINVSLRPVGYDKVESARLMLMQAFEAAPLEESTGAGRRRLPLGDKSTPEEIWEVCPGMSKGYFKHAVGYLLRLGAIEIGDQSMVLLPEGQRKPVEAGPFSGKSPRGWRYPEGATIFVANLAFGTDELSLAKAVEQKVGYGKLAAMKISRESDTGKARGFAYLSFFSPEVARECLAKLATGPVRCDGRELRFEMQVPAKRGQTGDAQGSASDGEKASSEDSDDSDADGNEDEAGGTRVKREPRDWGASSQYGIKGQKREGIAGDGADAKTKSSSKREASGWVTVYAGDLPYTLQPDVFKFLLEDSLGESGAVADVRLTKDFATGKSRGFGFVDFYDSETAERAVKELSGMTVMGRPIRLDVEGPKKPRKDGDGDGEGGDRRGGGARGRERGGPPRDRAVGGSYTGGARRSSGGPAGGRGEGRSEGRPRY